jgi:glycine/D-amino acid oxidase-like deaminating enzyme
MQVVVVGAGAAGMVAALRLSEKGCNVTLIEQGDIPHPRAASFDQHRIIRHLYPGQDGYAKLVDAALAAWDRLWARLGRTHLAETGVLALSTQPGDWSDRGRHGLERLGIAHEVWETEAIRHRLPQLAIADGTVGIYTTRGGALFPDRIATDLAHALKDSGVALVPRERVTSVDPMNGRVVTETGAVFLADRVLYSGGAWAPVLFPELGETLTPYRQCILYAAAPAKWQRAWAEAPMLVDLGGESGNYAIPPVGGSDLKLCAPGHRRHGDPDHDAALDENDEPAIRAFFRPSLPDIDEYRLLYLKTCFYTMTADDRFLLKKRDRLVLFSGCSAHGYKFAALNGEKLAQVILGEADLEATAKLLGGVEAQTT